MTKVNNKIKSLLMSSVMLVATSMSYAGLGDFFNISKPNQSQISSSTTQETKKEFLTEEQAFMFKARMMTKNKIEVQLGADEGYHLYHDSLRFEILDEKGNKNNHVTIGEFIIPQGKKTYLRALNKEVEEHTGVFTVVIPVTGKGQFVLRMYAQGCADQGLCYPPFYREKKLVAQ